MSTMPAKTSVKRFRLESLSTKEMQYHWKGVTGQQAMTSIYGEEDTYKRCIRSELPLYVQTVCWHVLRSAVNRPDSTLSTSFYQVQSANCFTSPRITENIADCLPRLVAWGPCSFTKNGVKYIELFP